MRLVTIIYIEVHAVSHIQLLPIQHPELNRHTRSKHTIESTTIVLHRPKKEVGHLRGQVLGPQRDRLVDQGKDAAQDVAHRVQTVANVALGKAQQSLTETASQAKQQIQQTVQETKDAVVSEAQHQGFATASAA